MSSTATRVLNRESLSQQLRHFQEQLAVQLPHEAHARLGSAIDSLIESQPAAAALRTGSQAPDFSLPALGGGIVTLSRMVLNGPVVLVFYRGSWCPYCDLQLRAYGRMLPELIRHNARLVAISPQQPTVEVPNAGEHRGLGFPILFDSRSAVARRYGLVYAVDELMRSVLSGFGLDLGAVNGSEHWELPVPATFVVTAGLQIRWSHVEADYRLRAEPDDILKALQPL
jgi:peroxiredoxin